jgi:hypothetical protein
MARSYQTTLASRERNRIHARKTRQRKKEHMQNLQSRADELKEEQLRLKLVINEKNTASILVGLFAKNHESAVDSTEDPRIEELLLRPVQDIPAADKISELPALILPGQHASTKARNNENTVSNHNERTNSDEGEDSLPDDGIDYDLLGKDRSKCSPEELDKMRRERNRMHAKRTRDRKRFFMEGMAEMCRQLEEENDLMFGHLQVIDPEHPFTLSRPSQFLSNMLSCSESGDDMNDGSSIIPSMAPSNVPVASSKEVSFDQVKTLLQAAGSFAQPSAVSCDDHDESSDNTSSVPLAKRRRLEEIPHSITI